MEWLRERTEHWTPSETLHRDQASGGGEGAETYILLLPNRTRETITTQAWLGTTMTLRCLVCSGLCWKDPIKIIVDTGSTISIIHPDLLQKANVEVDQCTDRLCTVTGETALLQRRKCRLEHSKHLTQ